MILWFYWVWASYWAQLSFKLLAIIKSQHNMLSAGWSDGCQDRGGSVLGSVQLTHLISVWTNSRMSSETMKHTILPKVVTHLPLHAYELVTSHYSPFTLYAVFNLAMFKCGFHSWWSPRLHEHTETGPEIHKLFRLFKGTLSLLHIPSCTHTHSYINGATLH